MRIVYYVVGWPPDRFPNGIVSATASIAPALRSAGADVRLLARYGEPGGDGNVTFVGAGGRRTLASRLRQKLSPSREFFDGEARLLAGRINETPALKSADIIEMEESFGWSRVVAANVAAPVITRLHGPYFLTGAAGKEEPFTTAENERIRREGLAIATTALSAPSKFVLDAVRKHYGLPLEEAFVIPNAARTVEQASGWRLGDADRNEILFVGRFDRIKGADIMLRAFAALAAKRPQLKLTFAGPIDHPMRIGGKDVACNEFVKSIMPQDAAMRVEFLGLVPLSELGALRRRAFATAICSRIEMFPNVALEALAHGSPLVATRVGGAPEIVEDGVSGLLAATEPSAVAQAIETLLDNPNLAAKLGAAGRARIDADFSPERVAAATLAAYREVMQRRAAERGPLHAGRR